MKQLHVAVILDRTFKALREKTSGILSFAGMTTDWELHYIPATLGTRKIEKVLTALHPDGMIGGDFLSDKFREYPVVTIDDVVPPVKRFIDARILCDNAAIGTAAAQRLLSIGFKNLAYVGAEDWEGDRYHSRMRLDAFKAAASQHGANMCGSFHDTGSPLPFQSATSTMQEWLISLPKPCGIFVYMDFLTQPIIVACRRAGLKIPDQVGIIGVDNEIEICENSIPTLSSIEPEFTQAGFRAAKLLDTFMRHGKPPKRLVEHYGIKTIHERMSTQNVAGPFQLVAAINEQIRLSATKGLTVTELSSLFNVSPRMLEYRYKNCLNKSIQSEIIRTRLEAVKNILKSSDIPICEISQMTGFGTSANLMTTFKKNFKMTMREWKRAHTAVTPRGEKPLHPR